MKKLFLLIPVIALLFAACGQQQTGRDAEHQEQVSMPAGDWYKHYTGKIAGQPVVLNLHHYGDGGLTGTYYYSEKSVLIDIAESGADSNVKGNILLSESVRTERPDEDDSKGSPYWSVAIGEHTVRGKWMAADGMKTFDIDLKEEYPEGTYAFDIITDSDSAEAKIGRYSYTDDISHEFVVPSSKMKGEDAAFFESALLRSYGGDTVGEKTLKAFIKAENTRAFADYKSSVADQGEDTSEQESLNYESSTNAWVVYNGSGIVAIETFYYDFSGGAHGNYWGRYLCIDLAQKKVWHLNDVISDTIRLQKLLDAAARKSFKIPADSPLNQRMLADSIPVTENFFFTESGITFGYSPYEVASYAEGQVFFFLPYTKMHDILTEDFKKRMKL